MKLKQISTITFDDREEVLKLLPHKVQVKFAIYCAELVQHLDTSVEGPKAIATAKAWLEGKATKEECKKAADDAAASIPASSVAFTNAYSASAAAVYATAFANASTATSAANASTAAYYASAVSSAANNKVKMVKYLQLLCLQEFHKENKLINLLFKV